MLTYVGFLLLAVLPGFRVDAQAGCQTLPTPIARPQPCIFPFSFRGKEYSACTADGDAAGSFWCKTETATPAASDASSASSASDSSIFPSAGVQTPVAVIAPTTTWGYCDVGCPLEQTQLLNDNNGQLQTIDDPASTNRNRATIIAAGASAALGAIVALAVVVYISRRGESRDGAASDEGRNKMLEHRLGSIARELGNSYVEPGNGAAKSRLQGSRLVSKLTADSNVTGGTDAVNGGRLSRNTSADSKASHEYNKTMYDLASSVLQTRIALNEHTGVKTSNVRSMFEKRCSMFENGEARAQDFDTQAEIDDQQRYDAMMLLQAYQNDNGARTPDITDPPIVYEVAASGDVVAIEAAGSGYDNVHAERVFSPAARIKTMSVGVRRALEAPKVALVNEQAIAGAMTGMQTNVKLDSLQIQTEMQLQRDVFENKKVSEQLRGELAGQKTEYGVDGRLMAEDMAQAKFVAELQRVNEQTLGDSKLVGMSTNYSVDGRLMSEDIAQGVFLAATRRVNEQARGELAGQKTEYGVDGRLMAEDMAQAKFVAGLQRVNEQFRGDGTVGEKTGFNTDSREMQQQMQQDAAVSQIRRVNNQFQGPTVGQQTLVDNKDILISRVRNSPKPERQNVQIRGGKVGDGRDGKADVSFNDTTASGMPTTSWRDSMPEAWLEKMGARSSRTDVFAVVVAQPSPEKAAVEEQQAGLSAEAFDASAAAPAPAGGVAPVSVIAEEDEDATTIVPNAGDDGAGVGVDRSTFINDMYASEYASEEEDGEGAVIENEWAESTALSERRSSYDTAVATPAAAVETVTAGENGKRVALV